MTIHGNILATPESAFANLADYPFTPNYADVGGLRMHYVDEGSDNDKTIFLLHGQPSWSYLYRHMIPPLVEAGYRVIAPDLIGFGRSDKPADPAAHTYQAHVDWMGALVDHLGIQDAAAFMQDWGGMIGLCVLASRPRWLSRLVVANTALSDLPPLGRVMMPLAMKTMRFFAGKPSIDDFANKKSFGNWSGYFYKANQLEIGKILQILTERELSPAEMSAYDAPFPEEKYCAGPRRMPQIIPTRLAETAADWKRLQQWDKPVLTLFSDKDPFLADAGFDTKFQQGFPGAQAQPHETTTEASHFLQEDKSAELAQKVLAWLKQTGF